MTNNFISNCSDVGIYLNKSSDTLLDHNTLWSTAGIDVRYEASTADIIANVMVDGAIRERQDGSVTQNSSNEIADSADIASLPELINNITPHSITFPTQYRDICGFPRPNTVVGAVGGTIEEQERCLADLLQLSM